MSNIIKISDMGLAKLNNAEFAYFTGEILKFAQTGTAEKLHIDAATLAAFEANQARLVELVAQSRIADETARIAETDKQQDDLLSYIFSAVKAGRNHPLVAKREAAQALYNVLKPYFGLQNLAQRQQVQTVDGMMADLVKDANAAHVTTLALDEEVEQLDSLNTVYRNLLAARADSQTANPVESAKPLRIEMTAQYDEITTTVWAFSIAVPAPELSTFVTQVNKLIADTTAAYNQRIAQQRAAQKKKNG